MMRSFSIAMIFAWLATGCAYGYAGQEGRVRSEPETRQDVQVVEVREQPQEVKVEEEPQETEQEAQSPCGVRTFEIHFYDATTRVTKTIDCVERRVVNVSRTPIGETTYQDARRANLPEGTWYLLVDPKGLRGTYLHNEHLLKLSRHFEIEFFGRDAVNDLLVYQYRDQVE